MATISSYTTGDWSNTATWSGSVVPVVGDRVNILAGHTVTVDGTYTAGDDTANGITISGTLKASRSVSSQLTVRGDLLITSGGTLDYGTEADPIPAAYTAVIRLNDSAAPAHNKWGLRTDSASNTWAGFRLWGADKTPWTRTTATATTTATVFTMADVTGWQVGDVLLFGAASDTHYNGVTYRAITAISGNDVTVGASLGNATHIGRIVGNLTRNVRVIGKNGNTYRSHVSVYVSTSFTTTDAIEIGYAEFAAGCTSKATPDKAGALTLYWNDSATSTDAVKRIAGIAAHHVWSVSGSTVTGVAGGGSGVGLMCYGNQAYPYTIEDSVVTSVITRTECVDLYSGTSSVLDACAIIGGTVSFSMGYSQGPVNAQLIDCVTDGGSSQALSGYGISMSATGCDIGNARFFGYLMAFGSLRLTDCTIGGDLGFSDTYCLTQTNAGSYFDVLLDACTITDFPMARTSTLLKTISPDAKCFLRNRNNDPTSQAIYRLGGLVERDNSTVRRSLSSLRMDPWHAGVPITHTVTVPVGASATVRIRGAARFNATYGTATPPSLAITGLGMTPVTWTATATADTWHEFDLDCTNPQTYPGELTITLTGQSAADTDTASCWWDGLAMPDFVTWVQHYGDQYDPTATARTDDTVVVLSEAAAGALSGISYSSGTLTVSGTRSLSEIYDWFKWYEASNRLAPIVTSADGVTLTLDANLTLSGTITGSGTIDCGAHTFSGSGVSSATIIHGAGRYVAITVTGYTVGARLQLYDVTAASELYNDIPGGASLSVNAAWTTNHTLRLRMARVVGIDADRLIEQTGLLTNVGASFLLAPEPDAVYEANAIDGSAVTEFTADYPNVQIDVSDPDNMTTPQRGYAWYMAGQMTSAGIAAYHGAMVAEDELNYRINVDVADMRVQNVAASACVIAGARLYRSDGTTIFAAGTAPIQADPGRAFIAADADDDIATAIAQRVVEGTLTLEQVLRVLLAHAAGNATGLDGSAVFKAQDGTTSRIVGTISGGTRTISSVDGS